MPQIDSSGGDEVKNTFIPLSHGGNQKREGMAEALFSDFKLIKLIAQGGFGKVYKVRNKKD